jgi:hypothetical protein
LRKLIKYSFSRGDFKKEDILNNKVSIETWFKTATRPDFSMAHEMWGSYPAFGLLAGLNVNKPSPRKGVGNKTPKFMGEVHEGSAFLMNTFARAINLAPVAKYYPEYAQLLGKYLLHVANNARIFFPGLGPEGSSQEILSKISKLYAGVPYERVLKVSNHEVYPSGDSTEWDPPWARTDLSYYSGCLTGTFAGILHRTSDETILQWDLNRSDFQAPTAYPTYLIYNPNNDERVVSLDIDGIRQNYDPLKSKRFKGFDAVDHRWVGWIEEGKTLKLRPMQALVLKLIPSDEKLIIKGNRLQNNAEGFSTRVVDYNFMGTIFDEQSELEVGESITNNVIKLELLPSGQLELSDIRAGGNRPMAIIGKSVSGAERLKWVNGQLSIVSSSGLVLTQLSPAPAKNKPSDSLLLELATNGDLKLKQKKLGSEESFTFWNYQTHFE